MPFIGAFTSRLPAVFNHENYNGGINFDLSEDETNKSHNTVAQRKNWCDREKKERDRESEKEREIDRLRETERGGARERE